MEDSASDTTRDGADTQTYSISSDDMSRLRDEFASLETELRLTNASGGPSYSSTVLQSVSDIRTSLDKIKSTPAVSTPDSSISGDGPVESKTSILPVCRDLIVAGFESILEDILEKLLELSNQGDIAAGMILRFFEDHCNDKAMVYEFPQILWKAMDEDPEFICEFTTRTRKMAVDFFTRKAHEASVKGLVEKLSNM